MLTHIRAKNFKSWADSGEVVLAPLTGFFGTNSSGKSSLLQLLLLLKQTIGREEVLFFGDASSLVHLGSFRDVIHGHDTDETLALEFGCKPQKPVKLKVYSMASPKRISHFTFTTSIRGGNVESLRYGLDSCEISGIEWAASSRSYKNSLDGRVLGIGDVRNCYGGPATGSAEALQPLTAAFEHQFSQISYLGPTRVLPQRCYQWEGEQPEDIGQSGHETIDALLSARIDGLTTPSQNGDVSIEERISEWLREMELAHSFSLKRTGARSEKSYEVRIKKDKVSPAVTLVDMGYGLSQFLPVLVLCYYAEEGSTLILEQPGIHLHPKVQSQLADLLIEVVTERNLQVIVESHSEHLLTRLQRRIAEEKIGADKTALYFCENKEGVSEIQTLDVDELGNIRNWPPDFFGAVRADLVQMTRAQMKRQKRTEG